MLFHTTGGNENSIAEKLRLDPQGKKKAALKFYEHFLPRFFACFMCRRRHANKLLTQQKTNAALNTAVTLPACLLFRDRVKGEEGWVSHKKRQKEEGWLFKRKIKDSLTSPKGCSLT